MKEKRPRDTNKETQKQEFIKRGRRIGYEKGQHKKAWRMGGEEANDTCGWESEGREDTGELKHTGPFLIFLFYF